MMRFNQFSYIPSSTEQIISDFQTLGLNLTSDTQPKEALKSFLTKHFIHQPDKAFAFSQLLADFETDLETFFQSDRPLTKAIFEMVALQLLDFIPNVDFTDVAKTVTDTGFPIIFDETNFLGNLHQLLATRRKDGVTLVDFWLNQGLLPVDNEYHFFNGKALPTFDTTNLIREIVYVETPLDTDGDGELDLVKVAIIRPRTAHKVPTMMTASPYHMGVNEPASDKKLYKMEGELTVKDPKTLTVEPISLPTYPDSQSDILEGQAEETFAYIRSFTLNDYFLPRGFANIYVSGIGTSGSTGFMTSGDYQQIEAYKSVIDWLNGKRVAYTSHRRDKQVKATWSNGKVATTGISYLGTMSTGLATTGVEGLEVIISEAGISSWYEYYRENGLVCSPGGYPGEDLDSLAELTYSRNLVPGDYLRHNSRYQELLQNLVDQLDRETGDYNQFWEERNYLPHAKNIRATTVHVHGLQDWNVKPRHVFNIFNAIGEHHDKHLILHQGDHVNIHNWQSIDFRESMLALLTDKLLGHHNGYQLPKVIWQNNSQEQTWETLTSFGEAQTRTLALGEGEQTIQNHYEEADFERYGKAYQTFKADLFSGKANAITLDLTVAEDTLINGEITLSLRLKTDSPKAILSAQLLDSEQKKHFSNLPRPLAPKTVDYGRSFSRDNLDELPFAPAPHRVITKGLLNLQNRSGLMTIEAIPLNDWFTVTLNLQPVVHQLKKGEQLKLVLYTTDFEHTIRDNSNYTITVDLNQSQLEFPVA